MSDGDFLSGTSGQVWGIRATSRAMLADAACDVAAFVTLAAVAPAPGGRRPGRPDACWCSRLSATTRPTSWPPPAPSCWPRATMSRSSPSPTGGRGKFENLNLLLERRPADGFDWLLAVDDDVALPRGFLDGFVFLAERFDLAMAQPAHRWRSHAAWNVTRRRPFSLVRETAFVEIGPLCALRLRHFETLLPFPPLRFGWGLDAHWSALARVPRLAPGRDRRDPDSARAATYRQLV